MNLHNIQAIGGIVIKEMYRRKDFYVLFVLTVLITGLAGSINLFNDVAVVRYLKELCLTLIWISSLVIAISTAARQIPSEKENRTIFPLLAKPVSRADLLIGKFAGCWMASGLALVVFYIFFALVISAKSGNPMILNYLQALWLHWLCLAVVIAISLLGSLVFTSVAANITISFVIVGGILTIGRHLGKVGRNLDEPVASIVLGIYYVIPQLEFFDTRSLVVHNWPLIQPMPMVLASLYGAAYSLLFLTAAWLLLRRKSFD